MTFITYFIETPRSWDSVASSLQQLSRGRAKSVRFAGAIEELQEDTDSIDVVILSVAGMANYALEIYAKGMLELSDDTVGMHLACSIHANVLVPDELAGSKCWLLLRPNGIFENVALDEQQLREAKVEYKISEAVD